MKNRLLFHQDVSLLVKSGLCPHKDYLKSHAHALKALKRLEKKAEDECFPFLRDPFDSYDCFTKIENDFRGMKNILIIGSPSSTRTLRALASLLQSWVWVEGGRPRLCFLDEVDPEVFWEIMSIANPLTTGVIVFSESGENEGALLQLMRCLEYWHGMLNSHELAHHFLIITTQSEKHSRLQQIASFFNFPCLDYPRTFFSGSQCFSKYFLLPLSISGFDVPKFYQGAAQSCLNFFKRQSPILEGGALVFLAYHLYGIKTHAYQASNTVFTPIVEWMKDVRADICHKAPFVFSQQEGLLDPCFLTVFFERHVARERLAPDFWKGMPSLKTLAQTSLLEYVHSKHIRLCQKTIDDQNFLRVMTMNSLNEEVLGALMMSQLMRIEHPMPRCFLLREYKGFIDLIRTFNVVLKRFLCHNRKNSLFP